MHDTDSKTNQSNQPNDERLINVPLKAGSVINFNGVFCTLSADTIVRTSEHNAAQMGYSGDDAPSTR